MVIYGAGMAGLLAAHMLRRHDPVVYEAAKALPDNHGALLRFRTDAVARATNLPFRKVTVHKAIKSSKREWLINTPDLSWSNMYSRKVTGEVLTRSILDLSSAERYIAPPDFISSLARGTPNIYYENPLGRIMLESHDKAEAIISTIPMPALMAMVDWPEVPNFKYLPVWSIRAHITKPLVDVYQTIYYPDADNIVYRASITGSELIVECIADPSGRWQMIAMDALMDFGVFGASMSDGAVKFQKFGKILPIDERIRKEFILYMSDKYNLYSVGRFATWRQLLLDDVVEDIQFVERFITERASYSRKLHHVTGK